MKYLATTIFLVILNICLTGQCVTQCDTDITTFGNNAGILGTSNSFFGNNTGQSNLVQGIQNSFFGNNAGFLNTSGAYNSFVGANSGLVNNSGTDNSFFGSNAGLQNVVGSQNSFFGRLAGAFNTASDNSFFGYAAGDSTTTGTLNTFVGSKAGRSNSNAALNSFFGALSGEKNNGGANSFFGFASGGKNTTGSGNSFYGLSSGTNNTTGRNNSFFGQTAGQHISSGSNNIAIGNNAGPSFWQPGVDSTLYIDVEATDQPLIYGQFNQRIVRINGSFEAMGGMAHSSDVHRKEEITPVTPESILDKLSAIEVSEWSYKDDDGIRHIGPMAQDFHKAFGLGRNETTITTIDADGVALASIQAIYELLKIERKRNDQLEKRLIEMSEKIGIESQY